MNLHDLFTLQQLPYRNIGVQYIIYTNEYIPKLQIHQQEPPLHQVNGKEHEGDDNQYDPSQEHNEEDDNINDLDHHASENPPSQEHEKT